jgi:hypothetical protein
MFVGVMGDFLHITYHIYKQHTPQSNPPLFLMPTPKYDWNLISKDYIQGIKIRHSVTGSSTLHFPTQEELCQKYGCNIETLRERSSRGSWVFKRNQFRNKLGLQSTEFNPTDLLGDSVRFDSMHINALENIMELVEAKLQPYMDMLRDEGMLSHEGMLRDGSSSSDLIDDLPPISVRELKDLVGIIKDSHATVRGILGEQQSENLLDEVKDQLQREYLTRAKKLPSSYVKEKLKKINDVEEQMAAFQARKLELEEILRRKKKTERSEEK